MKKTVFLALLIIFSFARAYCAQTSSSEKWVIAAEKFRYIQGQGKSAVSDSTAEMIPQRILENTSTRLERHILPTEEFSRLYYESKKDRQSLFLQLSSAVKKRDALVLGNYTDAELKKQIAVQNKNISDIYAKIDESIKTLEEKKVQLESFDPEASAKKYEAQKNEGRFSLINFFKDIFSAPESAIPVEQITFYNNDAFYLYNPPELAARKGYESSEFERAVVSAGINALLTGTITSYGNYLLVTVDVYLYPGAEKIGTVSEVGTLADSGFIASGIAYQLVPILTNSMPVRFNFNVEPYELKNLTSMYVDDTFYTSIPDEIIIDSGIHTVQFLSDGYRTISASYYFEGNKSYEIKVLMEPEINGEILMNLRNPLQGKLFAAGIFVDDIMAFENSSDKQEENSKTQLVSNTASISVNGKSILGQFIDTDGNSAFFYIPENLLKGTDELSLMQNSYDNIFVADINPFDRGQYIEKRRRWMYGAYSSLVVSLIPYFIIKGNVETYSSFNGSFSDSARQEYQAWKTAYNIYQWVPLVCGAFFGYEFVRYLLAANTVLPVNAKKVRGAGSESVISKPEIPEIVENEENNEKEAESSVKDDGSLEK